MFESNNNYNYKLGKTFGESKGNKMPMINNKLYSTNGELQKITVPKIVTIKR